MAAYSAILRGASRVYVVDRVPERLQAAEKIGCVAIDFSKGDAVEQILKHNDGMLDRAVDAVGYQAVTKGGDKEQPNIVLENMIKATRPCGGLGIPGLYVPTDPGAPDEASGKGLLSMSFGKLFEKVRGSLDPDSSYQYASAVLTPDVLTTRVSPSPRVSAMSNNTTATCAT